MCRILSPPHPKKKVLQSAEKTREEGKNSRVARFFLLDRDQVSRPVNVKSYTVNAFTGWREDTTFFHQVMFFSKIHWSQANPSGNAVLSSNKEESRFAKHKCISSHITWVGTGKKNPHNQGILFLRCYHENWKSWMRLYDSRSTQAEKETNFTFLLPPPFLLQKKKKVSI